MGARNVTDIGYEVGTVLYLAVRAERLAGGDVTMNRQTMTSGKLAKLAAGIFASITVAGGYAQAAAIKVVCVGEQTTLTGHYAANLQWPALLGNLLGSGYVVENDGDNNGGAILQDRSSGAPLLKDQADCGTYMNSNSTKASTKTAYTNSLNAPDIVVIGSWGKHDERFALDANIMVDQARF